MADRNISTAPKPSPSRSATAGMADAAPQDGDAATSVPLPRWSTGLATTVTEMPSTLELQAVRGSAPVRRRRSVSPRRTVSSVRGDPLAARLRVTPTGLESMAGCGRCRRPAVGQPGAEARVHRPRKGRIACSTLPMSCTPRISTVVVLFLRTVFLGGDGHSWPHDGSAAPTATTSTATRAVSPKSSVSSVSAAVFNASSMAGRISGTLS